MHSDMFAYQANLRPPKEIPWCISIRCPQSIDAPIDGVLMLAMSTDRSIA